MYKVVRICWEGSLGACMSAGEAMGDGIITSNAPIGLGTVVCRCVWVCGTPFEQSTRHLLGWWVGKSRHRSVLSSAVEA